MSGAHVTLITLGVADVAAATSFYEVLGFHKSSASHDKSNSGSAIPALWPTLMATYRS